MLPHRRVVVLITTVVVVLYASACGNPATRSAVTTATDRVAYVALEKGTYRGTSWQLYAYISSDSPQGSRCMDTVAPGRPRSKAWGAFCQFNAKDGQGYSYYYSTAGPKGSLASYGPLPSRASRVRLAAN